MDINALVEKWAKAVREQNIAGIRADRDYILVWMCQVRFCRGASMPTWLRLT
jgi:hypothetical protein